MRLTQIALGLTLLLLCATGYVAWQSQQEARGVREQLEFIKRQQQAQIEAGAVTPGTMMRPPQPGQLAASPPAPPVSPSPLPPPSAPAKTVPPTAGKKAPVSASLPPSSAGLSQPPPLGSTASVPPPSTPVLAAPAPPPLTPLQKQIVALPTIAKVKQFEKDAGFVIISAGKSQRITKGTQFDLRRENSVVGRIIIGDTIEDDESVGDLDPASVPAGVTVQAGDEVIQVVSAQ